jgi:hypothetical protein
VIRPALAATTLVPLAALLSGCAWLGASRPSSAADGPRLSRADLVSRAEAACLQRARALAALRRPRTRADRRAFFTQVASIERAEADALAALRPPRRDEREYVRLLVASAELAEVSERFVVALARNNGHGRRRALADADQASAAYDRAARGLGLSCRQSA